MVDRRHSPRVGYGDLYPVTTLGGSPPVAVPMTGGVGMNRRSCGVLASLLLPRPASQENEQQDVRGGGAAGSS